MSERDRVAEAPGLPILPALSSVLQGSGFSVQGLVSTTATIDVLRETKSLVETWLTEYDGTAQAAKLKAPRDVAQGIFDLIKSEYARMVEGWLRGIGVSLGSSIAGTWETHSGYSQLVRMYVNGKLEVGLGRKMLRHWLETYTPTSPGSRLAWEMHMRGRLSRAEFGSWCKAEGWAEVWHDRLYDVYAREPTDYQAFLWFKKGLIQSDEMKAWFKASGWDPGLHDTLYKGFLRVPSSYEIMRLADYVELSDLWVREKLRADGWSDDDVNHIAPAIALRPLREEVRSLTSQIVWERQHGRITASQVESDLEDLGILPQERTMLQDLAERRYNQELISEGIEAVEGRCIGHEPGMSSVGAIKNEIMSYGVLEEKAQLIATNFYYRYVYEA